MAKAQALETTDAPVVAAPSAPTAIKRPLPTNRLRPAEVARNVWRVDVEPGTTVEDLKRRDFFGNMTRMLRRHDKIEVMSVDGSFEAELRVLAIGPKEAAVDVLFSRQRDSALDPDALAMPAGYAIEWAGDIAKHRVLRGRDVVKEGFDTRAAAQTWLGTYLQAMNR
jgi:hypothetical protein